MPKQITACHGGPASGIHLGYLEDPYGWGPTVAATLCGIGRDPFRELWWKTTKATMVTCETCYERFREIQDDTKDE